MIDGAKPADTSGILRPASFDLVVCFADSLNYLTEDGDLERVFRSAAAALDTGGRLVFDINTEAEYATWDEREVALYDGNDYFVYQQMNYAPETRRAVVRIVWFERQNERWRRGEETHHLRMWSDEDIRGALETAKLNVDSVEQVTMTNGERRVLWKTRVTEQT
jgi:SAM-dependent methyltransferase